MYIFLFETIFLGIQLLISGTVISIKANNIPFIILLAIVPTMGQLKVPFKAEHMIIILQFNVKK